MATGTRPRSALTRREFLRNAAIATTVGAIAPFSFVPSARAVTLDLERLVRRHRRLAMTPSIAVAVVRGDDIIAAAADGWANRESRIRATPQTEYQLASVSKTVTCAGIMTLVEEGLLDLDADINQYLPFAVRIPAAPHAPVTMRMLLTHTSAIRDRYSVWGTPYTKRTLYFHGDSPIALGDLEQSYLVPGGSRYSRKENFYDRRPGKAFGYSNLAVALAGYVAQVVSGTDFDSLCRQRILQPLGMRGGYRLADVTTTNLAMPYRLSPKGDFKPYFQYGYPDYPDGALRTSAVHLARWLAAFMNDGEHDGVRVLKRSTVREVRRNQIPDVVSWHQGLIWYGSSPHGYFHMGHTGGDFGEATRMFFRPDKRVGVVSLANSYLGHDRWHAFSAIEVAVLDRFS